jgi:hypothetical protein
LRGNWGWRRRGFALLRVRLPQLKYLSIRFASSFTAILCRLFGQIHGLPAAHGILPSLLRVLPQNTCKNQESSNQITQFLGTTQNTCKARNALGRKLKFPQNLKILAWLKPNLFLWGRHLSV